MDSYFYKDKRFVEKYIQMTRGKNGLELIEKLKPLIKQHARVLELGSGAGADFEILCKYFEVIGSDYSPEFMDRLKKLFPQGTFLTLDAAKLDTHLEFDAIYSNKVLHHLSNEDLEKSVRRQYEILNSEGIICHSIWKGQGNTSVKGLFVNQHNEISLKSFFSTHFDIIELTSYQEFRTEDTFLLIAKKKPFI